MGAAVVGVLAVDEAEVGLAVSVGVGEGELESVELAMEGVIDGWFAAQFVGEEVGETVLRDVLLAVVIEDQTAVEERVVAQAVLEILLLPPVILEDLGVGDEADEGAVALLIRLAALLLFLLALTEEPAFELAVAVADDLELRRQCVHCLVAHPVEPDRKLEDVVVVLAAGVDLGDAVDVLAEWNAAAVIAHRHLGTVALDGDPFAVAHDELVDGVVDDLFEHHVDAVGGVRSVSNAPDVHAGAQPDVLESIQGLDSLFVVDDLFLRFRHFASVTPLARAQNSTAVIGTKYRCGRCRDMRMNAHAVRATNDSVMLLATFDPVPWTFCLGGCEAKTPLSPAGRTPRSSSWPDRAPGS